MATLAHVDYHTDPHVCPLCGGPLTDQPLKVDLNTNTVMEGSQVIKLTPYEAVIMEVLLRSYPSTATMESLYKALYGLLGGPDGSYDAIRVTIHRLRRRIKPLRIRLLTEWGVGYRLVKER